MILDLGDLTFYDSNCVAMLLAAHQKAQEGTTLTLGNATPATEETHHNDEGSQVRNSGALVATQRNPQGAPLRGESNVSRGTNTRS